MSDVTRSGKAETFYGKTESQIIAGVAILLMIWHHLFSYPNWLIDGVEVNSVFGKYINYLVWLTARLGNICIYIFAFQSGFTLYQRPELYNTFRKRISRIFSFLVSYWIVCASFWIIGWLCNEQLPTRTNALLNMIGLQVGFYSNWINVTFGWYVLYYILLILSSPILYTCFRRDNHLWVILYSICILLILSYCGLQGYWKPFAASLIGILSSKYKLLDYLKNKFKIQSHMIVFWAMFLCCILILRILLLYTQKLLHNPAFEVIASVIEGIIAFLFIFALVSMINIIQARKNLTAFLCFMGNISMFLWFLHSFLFTGSMSLQKYVYYTSEPIIIFITALLIFVPIAHLFGSIRKRIKEYGI